MSDPVYYPDMPCHLAPLPPGAAPLEGCECKVCAGLRNVGEQDVWEYPVRPGTPQWNELLKRA